MRLDISMAKLNNNGIIISIENDNLDSIYIYQNYRAKSHKRAIEFAIRELNSVIDKLEQLKREEKPFNATTQDKINGERE